MNRDIKFRAWMPVDKDKTVWAMDYDILLYRGKASYDDPKKPDKENRSALEEKNRKQSGNLIFKNDIPEIIKLYKKEDMPVQDIADMYGVSVGQINECIQKNLEKY